MTSQTSSVTTGNRSLGRTLLLALGAAAAFTAGLIAAALTWVVVTMTPAGPWLTNLMGITAQTPWHFSRAAGTVAYLLLAGSTVWGLLLSTKIIIESVPAYLALAMHNYLSWLAVAFTALHAVALLFDSYYTYTLADLTVPFLGPYQPFWVGLGIISLYLMLVTSISFSFRKQLGQKRWRTLHYATFAVYLLATAHGAAAGTDSGKFGLLALYWGSGLIVLFLTNYRLLASRAQRAGA